MKDKQKIVKIKRRTALGLFGLTAAMAGCVDEDDGVTDDTTIDSSEDNDSESELNIAQLISDHESYVETTGFTMNVRVESPNLPDSTEKETVFKQDTETLDSLVTESVPGAEIEEVIHKFTYTQQDVELIFSDGTSSEDVLDVPDGDTWTLTGASVFDKLLVGAAVELAQETDSTRRYDITSHRILDIESGKVVVTDENVITEFTLIWKHDTTNTITIDLSDIGSTYL